MPLRGRELDFERAHQVGRDQEMLVTMQVEPARAGAALRAWAAPGGVLAGLAILFYLAPMFARRWAGVRGVFGAGEAEVAKGKPV
jgi:hypothetical protein